MRYALVCKVVAGLACLVSTAVADTNARPVNAEHYIGSLPDAVPQLQPPADKKAADAAASAAAAAVNSANSGTSGGRPGDPIYKETRYQLTVFSEPGFRGEAARLNADQCVPLAEHQVAASSVKLAGNSCCFFFPTEDCRFPQGGQRVVGNVRDTRAWGFPRGAAAVKCLSKDACAVLKHGMCDLDRTCGDRAAAGMYAGEQGKCPFVPTCDAYSPTHLGDWVDVHSDGTGYPIGDQRPVSLDVPEPDPRDIFAGCRTRGNGGCRTRFMAAPVVLPASLEEDDGDEDNEGGSNDNDTYSLGVDDDDEATGTAAVPATSTTTAKAAAPNTGPAAAGILRPVGGPVLERFEVGPDGRVRNNLRPNPPPADYLAPRPIKKAGPGGPKGHGDINEVDAHGEPIINHRPAMPNWRHWRKNRKAMRKWRKQQAKAKENAEKAERKKFLDSQAEKEWARTHPVANNDA